jgi:endonuclease/exonuclease/phosphatase family metal-dependent hydrolase
MRSNKIIFTAVTIIIFFVWIFLSSCSSIDFYSSNTNSHTLLSGERNQFSLITYNIKAIYKKDENQIDSVMKHINKEKYDFVLFQELFNESTRDYIIESADTSFYKSIIARVDYNSFPEFIFQDAGLFIMGSYPVVDLSEVEFEGDVCESNGIIHMILEKEMSKTNDFLANKSIAGTLFSINDSTNLFLFATHVQAIGSREHKEFQLEQIREFIENAVSGVIESGAVKSPKNLMVMLAGDFNSNAYSPDRFEALQRLLGYPRDLHMEFNGNKQEYTFKFRSRNASRRFDYIFAYDNINSYALKKVAANSINARDFKDKTGESISDHFALRTVIKIP